MRFAGMSAISILSLLLSLLLSWNVNQVSAEGPWAIGFETPLQSSIERKVLDLAKTTLDLDEIQSIELEERFQEHQRSFSEFAAHWRSIRDDLSKRMVRLQMDSLQMFELGIESETKLEDAAHQQNTMDDSFVADIRRILNDRQLVFWPVFQQRFNRMRWLESRPAFPEESIDLLAVLESAGKESQFHVEDENLLQTLRTYEESLDQKLSDYARDTVKAARTWLRKDRDRYQTDGDKVWMGEAKTGDAKRAKNDRQRTLSQHRAIRDVNRQYKETVTNLLPESIRSAFSKLYVERALRGFVRFDRLPGEPFLKDVLALANLSTDQHQAIDAFATEYRAKQPKLHDEILKAQDRLIECQLSHSSTECENQQLPSKVEATIGKQVGAEQSLIDNLWVTLTIEQQSKLTKPLATRRGNS